MRYIGYKLMYRIYRQCVAQMCDATTSVWHAQHPYTCHWHSVLLLFFQTVMNSINSILRSSSGSVVVGVVVVVAVVIAVVVAVAAAEAAAATEAAAEE